MGRDWTDVFEVDDHADLREHFTERTYRGREYRHLTDARHGVERGTAVVNDVVVHGFPSIPRTLVLDPGIPDFFDGPVTVEEKLNGYNVRVAAIPRSRDAAVGGRHRDQADDVAAGDSPWDDDADPADDLLAFTRGGFVCHYTTERVRELLAPGEFFREHPGSVLCGELVGPENPYTPHDYDTVESAEFRIFDVRELGSGDPLPVAERRALCEEYGFPQARTFGTHDPETAVDAVREAIAELDDQGREGVVLKSVDGCEQLKYTTSAIHRSDLAHAFSMPFDYGRDFLFSRVIREAFQSVEVGEDAEAVRERARALGEAILLPAIDTVEAVDRGETVGEDHTVRGDPGTVEALLAQFRERGLQIDVREDREADGERVVTFRKVARSTQDKTANYLAGGTIDE